MKAVILIFIFSIYIDSIYTDTQEQSQIKKKEGPGPIGCAYFGAMDIICNKSVVPCEVMPNQCSFFLYEGLIVDKTYHVKHSNSKEHEVHFDELLKCRRKKSVYVFYGYEIEQYWTQVLGCNGCNGQNAIDEMVGLQAYMTEHPGIAGFVLWGLEFNTVTDDPFPDFTENLSTYIRVMKSTFSDKEVAIIISGTFLITQYTGPQTRQWLDLKIISGLLDFVIISFAFFNECTDDFKHRSLTPLNGKGNYTMEKVKCILDEQGIPKEKIYFLYRTLPSTTDFNVSFCDLFPSQVCVNKTATANWCIENSHSLVEKGNYAKNNAAGFILTGIDLDYNTKDCCNCKKAYPTFQFLLDGFNNSPAETCPLFDNC